MAGNASLRPKLVNMYPILCSSIKNKVVRKTAHLWTSSYSYPFPFYKNSQ